ncbi:unnamed protein product, partial [Mycena citricolor]
LAFTATRNAVTRPLAFLLVPSNTGLQCGPPSGHSQGPISKIGPRHVVLDQRPHVNSTLRIPRKISAELTCTMWNIGLVASFQTERF